MDYAEYEKLHKKKRTRNIVIAVAAILAAVLGVLIFFDFGKTTYRVTEIPGYKKLPKEPVKVAVSYAPYGPPAFEYELTDAGEIAELTDLYFGGTFEKHFREARAGGFMAYFTFTDATGGEYEANSRIYKGAFIYYYENVEEMGKKFIDLAERHGIDTIPKEPVNPNFD